MLKATHKLILNPHDLFIAQLKCKLCYKIINTNESKNKYCLEFHSIICTIKILKKNQNLSPLQCCGKSKYNNGRTVVNSRWTTVELVSYIQQVSKNLPDDRQTTSHR